MSVKCCVAVEDFTQLDLVRQIGVIPNRIDVITAIRLFLGYLLASEPDDSWPDLAPPFQRAASGSTGWNEMLRGLIAGPRGPQLHELMVAESWSSPSRPSRPSASRRAAARPAAQRVSVR